MMVTETAAAWASGAAGATNAFLSGFWFLDHLATAAATGHVAIARQTLIGGNYSMIDQNHDLQANPDFFIAKLWRDLVEGGSAFHNGRVLHCSRSPVIAEPIHRELRSYAFCGANGTLLIGVSNVGKESLSVELSFNGAHVKDQGSREEYVLQAPSDDKAGLQSRRVTLNGKLIQASMGNIPPLPARVVRDGKSFVAPAWSVSFVRFPNVFPGACRAQLRPASTRTDTVV